MNNKKTNKLSIIAFFVSIFSIILGTILSLVSLSQIREYNEKGKGFALGGIVINLAKILIIIFFTIIYILSPDADSIEYKCKHANNCGYDKQSNTYTCTFTNNGVEEYITCDPGYIDKTTTTHDGSLDDPDYIDTFDYDAA